MKRNLIAIAALLCFIAAISNAGELTLSNNLPRAFSQIQIKYKPDARFSNPSALKAFIYVFSEDKALPNAVEISLSYNEKEKTAAGSYLVPGEAIFGMLKIFQGGNFDDIYDNNKNQYWDFIVTDTSGKAVRGANLKSGISYMGSLPEHCRRRADFRKAQEALEEECKLYPDNVQAQIGLASLKFDLRRITRDEFEKAMGKFVEMPYNEDNELEMRSVCRALRAINKGNRADKIENDFANKHNKSEIAEEKLLGLLNQAKSLEQFTKISIQFFEHFPNSQNRDKIFSAFVNAFLQIEKLDELKKQLLTIDNPPPFVFAMLAKSISEKPELMPGRRKSERITEALNIFASISNDNTQSNFFGSPRKPYYYTTSEWLRDREVTFGSLMEIAGNIALEGENLEAVAADYFERALWLMRSKAGAPLFESLIIVNEELKDFEKSMNFADMAILNSIFDGNIPRLHQRAFVLAYPEKAPNYDFAIDSLKILAKNKRLLRLRFDKMELPPVSFVARTLDGKIIDSYDYASKNIILVFFSSWCEPCKSVFPALEQLRKKYADTSDILIAAMSIWEKDKDGEKEVLDIMVDGGFNFDVYFDDTGALSSRFGITGLPTIVYLDKRGAYQFKEEGIINTDSFLIGAEDKLEILRGN